MKTKSKIMGRYITGDIERKLWFAVQPSNAPSRFGGEESEPQYIQYYFDKESHLEGVEEEIKSIESVLGDNKEKFDKFFEENNGYNDEMLIERGLNKELLSDYADLLLGIEIRDCLIKNGECNFDCEL